MTAELEAYEGSSVSFEFENFGEAVFDKRCPICAKYLKWPTENIMMNGQNDFKPKPVCKVHGPVKPCFEGWF